MRVGSQIIRMIVDEVFEAILHKADKQKPLKGYGKSTTFKGRGGAWLIIGICLFVTGIMVWILVADKLEGD